MKSLTLVVESKVSFDIVQTLLQAANYPTRRINFQIVTDVIKVKQLAYSGYDYFSDEHTAILLDSNKPTIPDALASESLELSRDRVDVFFAVPAVEAWLFSDTDLLKPLMTSEARVDILNRLPLPEEIPYPKQVVTNLLNDHKGKYGFLVDIDIKKAAARSFSLNYFLNGIARILGIENHLEMSSMAANLDRRIFANLIKEVVPSNAIIYKTLDGTKITASEMLDNIEEGNSILLIY